MTHHITDEQIRAVFMANGFTIKEGHTDLKPYVYAAARALLALAAPQGEPYGWAVTGCHSLYRGEWAESTAQAEAKRCGGTAVAFPLYTAPAVPSDAEIEANIWPALRLNGHPNLTLYDCIASIRAALTAAPTSPAQPAVPESADSGLPSDPVAWRWFNSNGDQVTDWLTLRPRLRNEIESQVADAGGRIEYAYLQASPAVPEDVARDAERYRWLRDMASQDWLHRNHNYQNLRGAAFDAAIDAARAAGGAA